MNNLKYGLVSYASSANPIVNAKDAEIKSPKYLKSPNKFICGKRIKDIIVENRKPANKLIPPKDGLDSLLHLIQAYLISYA